MRHLSPIMMVLTLVALLAVVSMRRTGECPSCPSERVTTKGSIPMAHEITVYGLTYPYQLPQLAYPLNGLEPYIDTRTMEIHLTKHHQGYIDKLNKALEMHPSYQDRTLEWLLMHVDTLPQQIRQVVQDNGGGHFNHLLFWDSMRPAKEAQSLPQGQLAQAIDNSFGSFDAFKKRLEVSAFSHVGSGWTWLCMDSDGKLAVISTLNHDTPLVQGWYPLAVVDIWEHAYYLAYQNRRSEFIFAWWNLVDWGRVAERYERAAQVMQSTRVA